MFNKIKVFNLILEKKIFSLHDINLNIIYMFD
jgi:hypothetical protein